MAFSPSTPAIHSVIRLSPDLMRERIDDAMDVYLAAMHYRPEWRSLRRDHGKKQHTIRHGIAMARLQPLLHHLAPTMTRLLASLLATAAIHTRGGVAESQQV